MTRLINAVQEPSAFLREVVICIDEIPYLFNTTDYETHPSDSSVINLIEKITKVTNYKTEITTSLLHRTLARHEISYLVDHGHLAMLKPAPPPRPRSSGGITDLEVNVSQTCNMQCEYCCVGKGAFGKPSTLLTLEQSCDALTELVERTDAEFHNVTFFGGEPLLNFPVIRDTILYSRQLENKHGRKFTFRILTNGTAFNRDNVEFLLENKVKLQISIDGSQEAHDRWRTLNGGRPTYEKIRKALDFYFKNAKHLLTLRATMTKGNLNAFEVYKALEETGISKIIVGHANGNFAPSDYTEEDFRLLRDGYTQLANLFLNKAIANESVEYIGAPFNDHIRILTSGERKESYCGAGIHFVGLSARGEYSYCQDLAENPLAASGNVRSGLDLDAIANYRNLNAAVDNKPVCSSCWARYVCGGGCAALAISENKDISSPYTPDCVLIRHNIALSIWIIRQLQELCPTAFLAWLPNYSDSLKHLRLKEG